MVPLCILHGAVSEAQAPGRLVDSKLCTGGLAGASPLAAAAGVQQTPRKAGEGFSSGQERAPHNLLRGRLVGAKAKKLVGPPGEQRKVKW